jgi:hypothetical protein
MLSGGLNYSLYSVETSKNFLLTMSTKWSFGNSLQIIIFPVLLFLLLILNYFKKIHLKNNLAIIFIFSFVSLVGFQTAFVRSDEGHIIRSIYPFIITTFIALFYLAKKNKKYIILVTLLFLLLPYKPNFNIENNGIKTALSSLTSQKSFFDIYAFPRNYTLGQNDFNYLSNLITNNPNSVFVYPFDNFLLNIYGKTYNSFPLQYYPYSNTSVETKIGRASCRERVSHIV